ncbi:MAG: bifunctional ADP-dependent NAD(P)H-hydrate dehydratase/NAD(P)H-hydrate epimerase [Treponema sp.]|jgi:NAD(P)H-hydrate epimerase|nr:bifunctional ADP-dependent NAD(P)H-hydrate dehydratase/NAD(P)H-hydrate epimerase [Treponema sp.]
MRGALVFAGPARAMDAEAASQWFFDPFALVEAAGRQAAGVLCGAFPAVFSAEREVPLRLLVLAGSGNNAADALVILRTLILAGRVKGENAALLINKIPGVGERNPRSEAFRSLEKMGVRVFPLDEAAGLDETLSQADLIIDGIAGTGLEGALRGSLAVLVERVNRLDRGGRRPLVVSVDTPSGNSDHFKEGDPVLAADATLAIEPEKFCLYDPAARPRAGNILHVGGIFPLALTEKYRAAELVSWESALTLIPPVPGNAYKYSRGLVEIRAGSPGSSGAARIAARGAQAVGAGLIRLVADPLIHASLAANAGGFMVVPSEAEGAVLGIGASPDGVSRFKPHAVLLGPGWGKSPDRGRTLEEALGLEAEGRPLILDADAIALSKGIVFHGKALLTPHPGELAAYGDIPKEDLLAHPAPFLLALAREKKAFILFKSHVMFVAAPDGRLGLVDGMAPVLGSGGSGDLLAGFCAGIAARCQAMEEQEGGIAPAQGLDLYNCALAAAALLIRTARDPCFSGRFTDPLELADKAADLAGAAWLPPSPAGGLTPKMQGADDE